MKNIIMKLLMVFVAGPFLGIMIIWGGAIIYLPIFDEPWKNILPWIGKVISVIASYLLITALPRIYRHNAEKYSELEAFSVAGTYITMMITHWVALVWLYTNY